MNIKRRRKSRGFTLLELMTACGVIVIALSGLLSSYISCLEIIETAKNTNLAIESAQKVAEEMRSSSFLSLPGTYSNFTFNITGIPVGEGLGRVTLNATNSSLYEVAVGVCWRQKGSRIIGECADSSGILAFNDTDGDNVLSSPVQLTTLMAQR